MSALAEILALARREWGRMWGDKNLRKLLLLAPLLNAAIVCGVYGPSFVAEVPIAIVQDDTSSLTRRMSRWLDQHQKIRVTHYVSDLKEAELLFGQGKIAGYVVFERDFYRRIKRNEEARVVLFTDAGNMVLANTLSAAMQGVVQTFSVGLAVQKVRRIGAFKEQAQALVLPIRSEVRALGNPSFSYADFMLPGMLLAVLQQVILLALALTWAGERELSSGGELFALSQRSWVILIGKNLPHILLHCIWFAFYWGVLLPLSSVSNEASLISLMVFSLLFVLVMVSWGTWLSLMIGDRLGATQALMFLAVPSFLLSGYTWPSASLPGPLYVFSQILPLTHSAVMFRKMQGMGYGVSAFPQEVLMLLLLLAVNIVLAFWALRRYRRHAGPWQAPGTIESGQ